jgi:aldehyde dehydrogenase (NAD+)
MTQNEIIRVVDEQRQFFNNGATRNYSVRHEALCKLKDAMKSFEGEIHAALKADLAKPEFEAYFAETGFCQQELTETIRKLRKWMKPKHVRTGLLVQPARSTIHYSPRGVNLIIFSPLIAAIAAGNTAVIKTSEMTPACSAVTQKLIDSTFDPRYIAYVPGNVPETTILLEQKFDHIFFTGSARVGSIVMSAAARTLTPVTLELGGKSPCIVHRDAKLDVAVNRIVAGKFMNAGQTCVAPDYIMVHRDIKEAFLSKLKTRIIEAYGEDSSKSVDYGRMVSGSHFERVAALIIPEKVVVGGQMDATSRFIAPTVMRNVTLNDAVMTEEIFGPVLPVLDYTEYNEIYDVLARLPQHPLAAYVFSSNSRVQNELIERLQFGGGCVNQCVLHLANPYLPFGGVGESGIGAYHGFSGFERFSHKKGVMKSATWLDLPLIYAPYKDKLKWLRRIMK